MKAVGRRDINAHGSLLSQMPPARIGDLHTRLAAAPAGSVFRQWRGSSSRPSNTFCHRFERGIMEWFWPKTSTGVARRSTHFRQRQVR